jgi:hypothetical protein
VSTTPQATTTTTNTTTSATPPKAPANSGGTPSQTSSLLVKVYMDGLPIGRKVDLVVNNSYDKLKSALEDLFQQFIGIATCPFTSPYLFLSYHLSAAWLVAARIDVGFSIPLHMKNIT